MRSKGWWQTQSSMARPLPAPAMDPSGCGSGPDPTRPPDAGFTGTGSHGGQI